MPKVNTYLSFNGSAAEAMRFYQKTLGGNLDRFGTPWTISGGTKRG